MSKKKKKKQKQKKKQEDTAPDSADETSSDGDSDKKAEDESEHEENSDEKSEEESIDEGDSDEKSEEESTDEGDSDEKSEEESTDEGDSNEKSEEDSSEDAASDKKAEDDSEDEDDSDEKSADGSDSDGENNEAPQEERRRGKRKGIRLNKLISARVKSADTEKNLYLHIVDISEGGLRLNSDNPLPGEGSFQLTLTLDAFGPEIATEYPQTTFKLEVVWQKELVGGMWVTGVKFIDPTDENKEVVSRVLKRASPEGRRLRFRLNRVLGVEIGREEGAEWIYPLALDLSVEGMRVRLDNPLEIGREFPIKVFLEFELPTVEARAKVVWQEEMSSGRHQVGLKFVDIDDQNAATIKDYIDRCLAQDSKKT